MIIETLQVGQLGTNCYIVMDEQTKQAVVIDPGGDAPMILATIKRLGATVEYIVDTHGHFDHVMANAEVKQATGAKLAIHALEEQALKDSSEMALAYFGVKVSQPKPDLLLNEGDELKVGNITFSILHTPGHTRGGMTLVTDGKAFVGDCLFFQGIGRTDFPGGSMQVLMESIHNKLMKLDDSTMVYSGHGPVTTIGQERRTNPWLFTQ